MVVSSRRQPSHELRKPDRDNAQKLLDGRMESNKATQTKNMDPKRKTNQSSAAKSKVNFHLDRQTIENFHREQGLED